MIALDRIRIKGFRGIRSLEMPLGRNCVLIGANNCGKTSVLKALHLALSDEAVATRADFHYHSSTSEIANEILIDVRFVPVNEAGERLSYFDSIWTKALQPGIQMDRRRKEYFAFRSRFVWDSVKESACRERFLLSHWDRAQIGEKFEKLMDGIQMVRLDVDEDLRSVLSHEGSFQNRAIKEIHQDLINHPQYIDTPIEDLRQLLNRLSETLEGPGSALPETVTLSAETIGQFFQWIKNDQDSITQAMMKGLGSQKTLMTLSTVTLIEGLTRQAKAHQWPLFILIVSEEPELHLHPNAQRTLMRVLMNLSHQLIVSTHSPYVASVVDPQALRSMSRVGKNIDIRWLPRRMDPCDVRMLKRLILRFRGEVLFANGLMFVEGVTEEQLIRGMFHAYFGEDPSAYGITIVGVDGKSYSPFLLLAMSLRKPFCIVSDNDGDTSHVVLKQLTDMEKKLGYRHEDHQSGVFFLSPGLALEGELVQKLKIRAELIESLLACSNLTDQSPKNRRLRRQRYLKLTTRELKHRLEKKKAEYSGFLGDIIQDNPFNRPVEDMLPQAVKSAFELMKQWLHHEK